MDLPPRRSKGATGATRLHCLRLRPSRHNRSMPRVRLADNINVMQQQDVRGKRVTVAGLGHFGGNIAAARWLVEQGAAVTVTDKATADKLADSVKHLDGLPISWRLGEHREEDFTKADLVVASPAIPTTNPYLQAATNAGVPITTEIRLVVERCPATIVGVTGTKGKSTTTALLGLMLKTRRT